MVLRRATPRQTGFFFGVSSLPMNINVAETAGIDIGVVLTLYWC